jgi:nicotinic acid mononucleotide adenylyltransferase
LYRKLGQFTVPDTLPLLQKEFKGQDLTLILGSDVAKSLRFWNGIVALNACVSFAFGVREGCDPTVLDQAVLDIQNDYLEIVEYSIFEAPEAGMSSTQIREGMRNANELHPGVAAYLIEHSLYPQADTSPLPMNV